jgi:hypothetical protein
LSAENASYAELFRLANGQGVAGWLARSCEINRGWSIRSPVQRGETAVRGQPRSSIISVPRTADGGDVRECPSSIAEPDAVAATFLPERLRKSRARSLQRDGDRVVYVSKGREGPLRKVEEFLDLLDE